MIRAATVGRAVLEVCSIVLGVLLALLAALTNAGADETPTGDFLPGVQISDSAWRVLGATGLSTHIDDGLLLDLSRLYGLTDVYRRVAFGIIDADLMISAMSTALKESFDEDDREALLGRNFAQRFALLVGLEAALIDQLDQSLARLAGHLEDL